MTPLLLLLLGGAAAVAVLRPASSRTVKRGALPAGLQRPETSRRFGLRPGALPGPAGLVADVAAATPLEQAPQSEIVMSADGPGRAWARLVTRTIVPLDDLQGTPNAEIFPDGSWARLEYFGPMLQQRAMRDALIMDTLQIGYAKSPETAAKRGKEAENQINAVMGEIGRVAADIVGGLAVVAATLTALGVNAGFIGTITATMTAAAAAMGPFAAAVGVMAAIVAILAGALGIAEGHQIFPFLEPGIAATPDVLAAVKLRDQGGRLSSALDLIAVQELFVKGLGGKDSPDQYLLRPEYKTTPGYLDEQRALEAWIADFLLRFEGLPYVGAYTPPLNTGLDWLGGSVSRVPLPMRSRRYLLAVFAGLGEAESQWLAESPGTRGAPKPVPPTRPV